MPPHRWQRTCDGRAGMARRGLQSIAGALIDAAAGTFAETAGVALEGDRLPPDDHRPWPVPKTPWVMAQTWEHLLFAHWAVRPTSLAGLVPAGVDLDTFDGSAWVGVTPFRVSGLRLRGLPAVPGLSEFREINVRTYVTMNGKPGVWFFTLDADTLIGIATARTWYRLPYVAASIQFAARDDRVTFVASHDREDGSEVTLAAEYAPTGPVSPAAPGTLDAWLTERYCLYAAEDDGRILRAEIHHAPWPLQPATAAIRDDGFTASVGVPLSGAPDLLHYARRLDVAIWRPGAVRRRASRSRGRRAT